MIERPVSSSDVEEMLKLQKEVESLKPKYPLTQVLLVTTSASGGLMTAFLATGDIEYAGRVWNALSVSGIATLTMGAVEGSINFAKGRRRKMQQGALKQIANEYGVNLPENS